MSDYADRAAARNAYYGVDESNPLTGPNYHSTVDYSRDMSLGEAYRAGAKVTRLRVLKEYGYCDISYLHATLPDGTTVNVRVDVAHMIRFRDLKGVLIAWAKREGAYAVRMGLLDEGNWSVLR